jgi:phage-related baseplate assembly protein
MIDINTLPLPSIIEKLDYEDILNQDIDAMKIIFKEKLGIDWKPVDSDDNSLILQALAYRELHLRNDINEKFRQLLLAYTTGSNLDHKALEYDTERLKGSKPYAPYEFAISTPLEYDLVINTPLVLTDETSTYESNLLEDLIIAAGETAATGTVELQKEIYSLDIKTETITTSLPYVLKATSKGIFTNGKDVEKDDKLLYRILLSFADKSTAGSEESYKSYTYKADARIEDVKVLKGLYDIQDYAASLVGADLTTVQNILREIETQKGMVKVYYYSPDADALMQTRIEEQLNDKQTRPLSDTPIISKAEEMGFCITALLKILPNQESGQILINAKKSLDDGLKELRKIGETITLSEINKFLKVDGVKEVIITEPPENIAVQNHQIGVNSGTNTITTTTI